MQEIISPIGNRFNKKSNYDLLRDKLIKIFHKINLTNINNLLINDIKFKKAIEKLAFYYILKKLVVLTKHFEGVEIYINGTLEPSRDKLKIQLAKYFKFEADDLEQISILLLRLIRETKSNYVKSISHRTELNEFAFDNEYRCYICGSTVDYLDSEKESYRTIEHLQPRSFGGNKHQKNLFIACKRCNQIKDDMLTWLEKNIFNVHRPYINHEEGPPSFLNNELIPLYMEEKFEKFITDEIMFVVLSMYNYKCSICNTDNDISDLTYILEKESDDYFHILNLMPVCNLCLKEIDKNLLNQDNYIKRKRITNVNN